MMSKKAGEIYEGLTSLGSSNKKVNEGNNEDRLIKDYQDRFADLEKAEDKLNDYFSEIVDDMIKKSKSIEDYNKIKERLRKMPDSSSKVLLFRKIIMAEKSL